MKPLTLKCGALFYLCVMCHVSTMTVTLHNTSPWDVTVHLSCIRTKNGIFRPDIDTQAYPLSVKIFPGTSLTLPHTLFLEDSRGSRNEPPVTLLYATSLRQITVNTVTYRVGKGQTSTIAPNITRGPEYDPHIIDNEGNYIFVEQPSELHISLHLRAFQSEKL